MQNLKTSFFVFLVVLVVQQGCQPSQQDSGLKIVKFARNDVPDTHDTIRNLKIVWDKTEKKISHDIYFSEYGRVRRLAGDTLLLIYHCGPKGHEWDNIALRKSDDNGKSWLPPRIIVPDNHPNKYYGFSTPDLLVLQNKWLLLSYAGRGIPDDSTHNNLQVRLSKDKGVTWSSARIVSLGRSWEPGAIQLPDGEIELFYSNEILSSKKAKGRHEQKILMIRSRNNGSSWTSPEIVEFLNRTRAGMPVPVVLNNHKGIIFLIEMVESNQSPAVIWSSMKARWNYESVATLQNGRRWIGSVDPIWGGAPSLVQLSTGETILCIQTEGGRKIKRYTEWKKNTVVIMTGNSVAKNFGNITFPYPDLPVTEGRYFNSLFLKNDKTVVLISTRNLASGRSVLYWKEGHIYR